jgi:hypothetical protein
MNNNKQPQCPPVMVGLLILAVIVAVTLVIAHFS